MYRLIRTPEPPPAAPTSMPPSRPSWTTPAARCWCWPDRAPGKTTTLVESVVDRIERRGVAPDRILVLTFSRQAAADLRARIAARLGRTTVTPLVMTFHAFCYALVRRFADRVSPDTDGMAPPIRLLTGPEQEFRVRETLQGSLETQRVGVAGLAGPRLRRPGRSPPRSGRCWPGPGSSAWTRTTSPRPARRPAGPEWVGGRGVLRGVPRRARRRAGAGLRRARPPLPDPAGRPGGRQPAAGRARTGCSSTSTRTPTRPRSGCCRPSPATAATWSWSATRTSRSTPSAARRSGASSTSRTGSAPATGPPLRSWPWARPAASDRRCWPPAATSPGRLGIPRAAARRRLRTASASRSPAPGVARGSGGGLHLRQPGRGGRAHRGDPAQRPPAGRRALGRDGGAGAGGPVDDPRPDPGPDRGRRARRGGRGRDPARRRPGGAPAAARPAGGGPRLRGRPGRGPGAAQLPARRAGQHGRAPARPGPARRRAGRAGRHRAAPAVGRADAAWPCADPDLLAERGDRPEVRGGPPAGRPAAGGAPAASRGGHTAEEALGCCGPAPTGRTGCGSRRPVGGEAGRRANRDLDAICALFDIAARSRGGVRAARA